MCVAERERERERERGIRMGIRFVLMVNKQGQTRLAQYYEYLTVEERRTLEGEIVRKCLARNENQVYASIPFFYFHQIFKSYLQQIHFILSFVLEIAYAYAYAYGREISHPTELGKRK